MSGYPALIGLFTDTYTAAQLAAGSCPALGTEYTDPANGKKYKFLQNSGATAITASLACVALGTDKSAYKCALAAATDAVMGFAGVRVVGASSMAQNECGWFQIGGPATFTAGATGTTVDDRVITSADAAGKVEVMAATVASHKASFGEAVTSTTADVVVVNIDRSVWG